MSGYVWLFQLRSVYDRSVQFRPGEVNLMQVRPGYFMLGKDGTG